MGAWRMSKTVYLLLLSIFPAVLSMIWYFRLQYSATDHAASVDRFFASCETTQAGAKMAVVIPFPYKQFKNVLQLLYIWTLPEFFPFNSAEFPYRDQLTLIFYPSVASEEYEAKLETFIAETPAVGDLLNKSFSSYRIMPANLSSHVDKYYRSYHAGQWLSSGTTEMFFPMVVDYAHTEFDYVFYHEPDLNPVRPGWLETIYTYVSSNSTDFWLMGTVEQNKSKRKERLFAHMNGNMIVRVQSACIRKVLDNVHKEFRYIPYDKAFYQYLLTYKNKREAQHVMRRLLFSDYIANFGDGKITRGDLLDVYPNLQIVHGRGYMNSIIKQYIPATIRHYILSHI